MVILVESFSTIASGSSSSFEIADSLIVSFFRF
ncbi:hypothetical protein H704_00724 [Bartonella bacilliformis Peru38]|nr:hypothetical protein X472_00350 [Bartonella bacilliformis San Pedro600-02]KEG20481.1 hypothetical protein H704_00724 [Bartonella bacilliformis Peru38]KEG22863.1 hypothetical protein H703_00710 [Bartonella bacilliformis Ver075]